MACKCMNDLNSESAEVLPSSGGGASLKKRLSGVDAEDVFRLDNPSRPDYVGAVIVAEVMALANQPAPGRSYMVRQASLILLETGGFRQGDHG